MHKFHQLLYKFHPKLTAILELYRTQPVSIYHIGYTPIPRGSPFLFLKTPTVGLGESALPHLFVCLEKTWIHVAVKNPN